MKFFKEKKIERTVYVSSGLREFRTKKKIGLRELSRALGISPTCLSCIETGKNTTTKKTAEFIENYLTK